MWFTTYESVDCGTVLMRNDTPCKAIGIGSIKIKTHDSVFRTLNKVRHIPDSKFSTQGGVMKVTKSALIVMKTCRYGSLYVLQGHTVTCSVTVSSSLSDSDFTQLRHMRLGHMSEKGMDILSKCGLLTPGTGKLKFCEHCVYEKQKKVSFSTTPHSTESIFDYIHSDLWDLQESHLIVENVI